MLEKSIQGHIILRYQPSSLPQKSGFQKKLMLEWDIFKSQKGGGGMGRLDPRIAGMGSNWNDDYQVQ